MNTKLIWILGLVMSSSALAPVQADDLVINSFSRNGVMTWAYPTNGVIEYRVQGAGTLGTGIWTNDLDGITPTDTVMSVTVSMPGGLVTGEMQ